MSRAFQSFDEQNAPEGSRKFLAKNREIFGKVLSPIARLAASPVTLEASLGMLGAFDRTSLAPLEREVLAMTLGRENGCHYCVALHRRSLQAKGAGSELIGALERGEVLPTPRLEALRRFVLALLEGTGNPDETSFSQFLEAGFTRAQALEVALGIGAYTLTTFANRLTEAPLD